MEYVCPVCGVERADYEGPNVHLPECPNCGVSDTPRPFGEVEPLDDVAKLIDELCKERIGSEGAARRTRDDSLRLNLRRGLLRLIDERIQAHLNVLELDDLT